MTSAKKIKLSETVPRRAGAPLPSLGNHMAKPRNAGQLGLTLTYAVG